MLTFLFILSIVICSLCYVFGFLKKKNDFSGLALILIIVFATIMFVLSFGIFFSIQTLGTAQTIDEKIVMYQEENAKIDQGIESMIKNYKDFETDTYTAIKGKNAIELVSMVPELKSDKLVQKQMELYINNREQIKTLKEEKIDVAKARWNLYFGK